MSGMNMNNMAPPPHPNMMGNQMMSGPPLSGPNPFPMGSMMPNPMMMQPNPMMNNINPQITVGQLPPSPPPPNQMPLPPPDPTHFKINNLQNNQQQNNDNN